ncbi:MAG TPA: hypothetical protein VF940_05035 [Streptosporangiaceae bacterium]
MPRQLAGQTSIAAAWTGRRVILAGVNYRHPSLVIGAYDPETSHRQMITPQLPANHPPGSLAMVATSNRVVLWSLWSRNTRTKGGFSIAFCIDVLARGRDGHWRNVTASWPQNRDVNTPE